MDKKIIYTNNFKFIKTNFKEVFLVKKKKELTQEVFFKEFIV